MDKTIVLAEPARLCREAIRRILSGRSGLRIVAEATNGADAVRAAIDHSPDLVLVELAMPDMSGIEAIRQICEAASSRCIALASGQTVNQVKSALVAGAVAFVPKVSSSEELFAAIDTVSTGRSYLPPRLTADVVRAFKSKGHEDPRDAALTGRQLEVLRLVAEGLSTKQVALELGISTKTVQTHRQALMARLGVHKVSGLVRFAVREGIVAI